MTKEEAKDYIREWCPYNRQEEIIKALEQEESCDDCVSRKAVDELCWKYLKANTDDNIAFYEHFLDLPSVVPQESKWISTGKRLPTREEYIANNGLFIVSDGNRVYVEHFDIYESMSFGKPTTNGFKVDKCVTAWVPLPKPYEVEMEEERE